MTAQQFWRDLLNTFSPKVVGLVENRLVLVGVEAGTPWWQALLSGAGQFNVRAIWTYLPIIGLMVNTWVLDLPGHRRPMVNLVLIYWLALSISCGVRGEDSNLGLGHWFDQE